MKQMNKMMFKRRKLYKMNKNTNQVRRLKKRLNIELISQFQLGLF